MFSAFTPEHIQNFIVPEPYENKNRLLLGHPVYKRITLSLKVVRLYVLGKPKSAENSVKTSEKKKNTEKSAKLLKKRRYMKNDQLPKCFLFKGNA